jgi:predicted MFS family arabinose efflux permease
LIKDAKGIPPYIAVVLLGVAGYAIAAIKPLMVTSYVTDFGLSTRLAGYLLGTEMTSMAVGTLAAAALIPYTRERRYVLFALLTILAGELGSMMAGVGAYLFGWRVVAGLGHGFALGRFGAAIATFEHPDRVSGVYTVCEKAFAAVFSLLLPTLMATIGPRGLFVIGPITALAAIAWLRWFPINGARSGEVLESDTKTPRRRLAVSTVVLVAVGTSLYYISIGAYWPFVGQFSAATGLDYATKVRILGWSSLIGICGSSISIVISDRFGRFWLIAGLLCLQLLSVVSLLFAGDSIFQYGVSACVYIFAWLAAFPYLMGLMSRIDPVGRLNGLLYTIAAIGFAIGPISASWLVGRTTTERVGLTLVQEISLVLLFIGAVLLITLAAQQRNCDAKHRTAGQAPVIR